MSDLITIADLDRWGACDRDGHYRNEVLLRWLDGRPGLTPLEVSRLRQVPCEDRLWVLLRPEVIGDDLCREAAHVYADRAVRRHALHCGVLEVEEWAEGWLSGEDRSAEAAKAAARVARAAWSAWATAWSARATEWSAEAVAEAAAKAAAKAAAWSAAEAAAEAAAKAAAEAAAEAAVTARAATWAAEHRWQLGWLRKRLEERDEEERHE